MSFSKHRLDSEYIRKQSKPFQHKNTLNSLPLILVPIKIQLEEAEILIDDCFEWNLNEIDYSPEEFAFILLNDLGVSNPIMCETIGLQIRTQVGEYAIACEPDDISGPFYDQVIQTFADKTPSNRAGTPTLDTYSSEQDQVKQVINNSVNLIENGVLTNEIGHEKAENSILFSNLRNIPPSLTSQEVLDTMDNIQSITKPKKSYGDLRILVKLDLHAGSIYLKDQFEFSLFEGDVRAFVHSYLGDLGLGGEFNSLVTCTIREQVVLARLYYDSQTCLEEFDGVLREFDFDFECEWEPEIRILSDDEIIELNKEEGRSHRRLRRSRQIETRSTRQSFIE